MITLSKLKQCVDLLTSNHSKSKLENGRYDWISTSRKFEQNKINHWMILFQKLQNILLLGPTLTSSRSNGRMVEGARYLALSWTNFWISWYHGTNARRRKVININRNRNSHFIRKIFYENWHQPWNMTVYSSITSQAFYNCW